MDDECQKIWSGLRLEVLKKTTKILGQNIRYLGRDTNGAPLEYKQSAIATPSRSILRNKHFFTWFLHSGKKHLMSSQRCQEELLSSGV
jgi:hypothetical protein